MRGISPVLNMTSGGHKTMETKKSQKKSEMLVEELKRRSSKALQLARKTILAEKTQSGNALEALEYYTLHWNDFTHPGFFSIACEAVGADLDAVLPVQAAITMMAAAFDIHDDLIDESRAKHGIQTVFGKFGKDIALLLGDAFLIEGFALLDESIAELPRKKMKEALETFKIALFELGNAHALELDMKLGGKVLPNAYLRILEMKASSIEADMRIGALVGGGTKEEIQTLAEFGRILGILATLREEFVDVYEVEELENRVHNECLPIPILYAMENRESARKIKKLLAKHGMTREDIDTLADIVFKSKSVMRLKKKMQDLVERSFALTSEITAKNSAKLLQNLAESALEDL
jgi:geranylgeranyl pyrophosphate synthase